MTFYYIDASAWVKCYYKETGTVWMQNFLLRGEPLACSYLGVVEVIATFARKHKAGEINASELSEKEAALEEDWNSFIQIQLTAEVMEFARETAKNLALRGADAVHLASAIFLQRRLAPTEGLVLITSDQELKLAAQLSGLAVIDPDEEETLASP